MVNIKNLYFVIRNKGNVVVSIMFNKQDRKYHFVNLTKNHICPCGFDSVEEAIKDMEIKKENCEIVDFEKIK